MGPTAASVDPVATVGTPAGSLRYFAVLFAPASARAVLTGLYACEAEIRHAVRGSTHDIAHARLQWWRGEIDRLSRGEPQHPATKALLPLRETIAAELPLLHELVVASDMDLACLTFSTRAELEAYCIRAAGALQTLAASASRGPGVLSPSEREFARRLGSAVCRTEILRDLRAHLAAGRLPLPLDELEHAGIDPHALRPDMNMSTLGPWLDRWRVELDTELTRLPEALSPSERAIQVHGRVLAALHRRLLARIDHRSELARTPAEVPPWTKMWTAWRTAVRHD